MNMSVVSVLVLAMYVQGLRALTPASCLQGTIHDAANGKCYIIRSKNVERDEAERNCENMGSILAIVNSTSEQSFLNSNTKSVKYWIGINDQETSRVFMNPDGSAATYFYWYSGQGQPNDDMILNNQPCVHMHEDKFWHDDECYNRENYVCQLHQTLPVVQVTFARLSNQLLKDCELYEIYTVRSRLTCQIECVKYQLCVGYVYNILQKYDNCQLITPLLDSDLSFANPGNQVYEAVER